MDEKDIQNEFIKDVYTSRDIRFATSDIQKIWPKFKEEFGLESGVSLEISCTYRSQKCQNNLYQRGRSKKPIGKTYIVTNCDGIQKRSNHQKFPSPAIDIWLNFNGKAIWDDDLYNLAGKIGKENGLNWGGDWKDFQDRVHFEIL